MDLSNWLHVFRALCQTKPSWSLKVVDWLKKLNKVQGLNALDPLCLWQCFLWQFQPGRPVAGSSNHLIHLKLLLSTIEPFLIDIIHLFVTFIWMELINMWKREETWKLSLPSESSGSVSSSSVGLHSCTIGIGIVPISEIFYQNILINRSNFRNISSNILIDWSHSWNNLSKYSFWSFQFLKYFIKIFLLIVSIAKIFQNVLRIINNQ